MPVFGILSCTFHSFGMVPPSTYVEYILYLNFLISTTFAQGQIAQFLDWDCYQKSPVNPTVPLPLDTCLVTSGALGILVQLLPGCPTGNATLQVYKDQSCATPDTDPNDDGDEDNNCFNSGNSIIPAVMFICGSVADENPDATSTTTVTAGSALVPVAKATGATATSTSGVLSSQTATDSNGLVASTTPASSASNLSQMNASSNGGDSGSGLSQYDQIIIGIIIPVAAIVVALLAWLYPRAWNRRGGEGQQNSYRMLHYPAVHHMPHWLRG